jgi:O-acetyl-ADP-ribose deacetylase (regulator of RNase III)
MHLGGEASADSVQLAVRNSLLKAKEKGLKSISFPAIGAGIGGLSADACARVSLEEARNHLAGETSLTEIRFVLLGDDTCAAFRKAFEKVFPSG